MLPNGERQLYERRIASLASAQSTKFIGMFPGNIDYINRLIPIGNKKLTIVSDFVGYGEYSAPESFDQYISKIKELAKTSDGVVMMVYGRKRWDKAIEDQFKEDIEQYGNREDRAFSAIENTAKFKHYIEHYNLGSLRPRTLKGFYDLLNAREAGYRLELSRANVRIMEIDETPAVFIWMTEERAVFALHKITGSNRETSCQTEDSQMLTMLQDISGELFGRYGQAASTRPK
jgi:hypothetical protein